MTPPKQQDEKTSEQLKLGALYSRASLRKLFGITAASLNTGIFRPPGTDSVWLFVTEQKASGRTPYHDELTGDDLHIDGQMRGKTDYLIRDHEKLGLELLLFHRKHQREYPEAAFEYKGRFRYVGSRAGSPTRFHLRRA